MTREEEGHQILQTSYLDAPGGGRRLSLVMSCSTRRRPAAAATVGIAAEAPSVPLLLSFSSPPLRPSPSASGGGSALFVRRRSLRVRCVFSVVKDRKVPRGIGR